MEEKPSQPQSPLQKLNELLRFEQTLFALPSAVCAAVWAADGWPPIKIFALILLAMVSARTAGMSANRLIDAKIDASNPRTRSRLLPSGKIRPSVVLLVLFLSLVVLGGTSWLLNPLCFFLSPLAVALLLVYSYLKRWTWACHFGLGLVQACGPIGAWIAVTGEWEQTVAWLGLGVGLWMAGFDILYALADEKHDREHGIRSIPGDFGARTACLISRGCHILAFLAWVGFALTAGGGFPMGTSLGVVGSLLIFEHSLVGPDRLEQLPLAFFKVNSLISVVLLIGTIGEHL